MMGSLQGFASKRAQGQHLYEIARKSRQVTCLANLFMVVQHMLQTSMLFDLRG